MSDEIQALYQLGSVNTPLAKDTFASIVDPHKSKKNAAMAKARAKAQETMADKAVDMA